MIDLRRLHLVPRFLCLLLVVSSAWSFGQQTPEALAALHKAEIEKWWPIIKAAGIKGE